MYDPTLNRYPPKRRNSKWGIDIVPGAPPEPGAARRYEKLVSALEDSYKAVGYPVKFDRVILGERLWLKIAIGSYSQSIFRGRFYHSELPEYVRVDDLIRDETISKISSHVGCSITVSRGVDNSAWLVISI